VNLQDLQTALAIKNSTVTVDLGMLGDEVDNMLRTSYDGKALTIYEASPGDGANNAVVIVGRGGFLATEYEEGNDAKRGLHVAATFRLDGQGSVYASVRYSVIGEDAEPGWKFSTSFPGLPVHFDYAQPDASETTPQLDELELSQSSFFVESRPGRDEEFKVDLVTGINFVGELALSGVMGLFGEVLFKEGNKLTISGAIVRLDPAKLPPPLPPLGPDHYAWDQSATLPGIYLRAPLTVPALTLGQVSFEASDFRIYSPPSYEWLNRNETYLPASAFTGKIVIPSADVRADIAVNTQGASGAALLTGQFKGITVAKLASLANLAGTGSLINDMPDAFKSIGDTLGKLELMSAKVTVFNGGSGLQVLGTSATIGMPDQVWRLWPGTDRLNIGSLYAKFDVAQPFSSPSVVVTVGGRVSIQGVPIDVSASNNDGFVVSAQLGASQTIPLKALMETYAPGVPPPSDLTIASMQLTVAPQKYYSFSTTIAPQPTPWIIPLGPTTLTVSDVSLYFLYPQKGSLIGSFSGTIALGSVATLSMTYSIPGPLVIEANLPRIGLTDLAREVAGAVSLPFPSGFPEIDLVDSKVRFTRDATGASTYYDFLLRTTVSVGGTAGLNFGALITRSDGQWGFAVGIWTPKWESGQGWSPGSLWEPLKVLEVNSAGLVISTLATDASKEQLIPISDVPALADEQFKIVAGVTFFATLRLTTGPVSLLRELFGDAVTFGLYASYEKSTSTTKLIAYLATGTNGAFLFESFKLIWDSVGASYAAITIEASGRLQIESEKLTYQVAGSISKDDTGLSGRIALSVRDWVHPFGYDRLTVKQFGIAIAMTEAGPVFSLSGTFQFTTKRNKEFLFGIAGALTFEGPTALAFALKSTSPGQSLRFGEVLEGITTIDVYDLSPPASLIPWVLEIKLIDMFLEIQELSFWAVIVDQVEINRVTYKKGFGLRGAIALFGIKVLLYVEVRAAEKMFAGSAEFPDEVRLGNFLVLSRPSTIALDSKRDLATAGQLELTPKGPVLELSSVIDATHKNYLYVAAHLQLFDIFRADILGQATDSGIAYLLDIQAGTSGQGAWAAQKTTLLVSREQLAFGASLNYEFGLKDVTLGGFKLFDVLQVPEVRLPDFLFKVGGKISGGLVPPRFALGGELKFQFMELNFDKSFDIQIDLSSAPQKLADFGAFVLAWIKANLSKLVEEMLNVVQKFADWVKQNFERFKQFATEVAQVLKDVFNETSTEVVKAMMAAIGWASDVVNEAVDTAYKICAATTALVNV